MNSQPPTDLAEFHRYLSEKVANGGAAVSPEQALDEWRDLHPDPDADAQEIRAIQEAIDDMKNGDTGIPFDEFDREFRKRHNLRPKS